MSKVNHHFDNFFQIEKIVLSYHVDNIYIYQHDIVGSVPRKMA